MESLLFSCRLRERFYGRCFASQQTDYEKGLGRFVLRWNVVVVDVQQEQTKEKNLKTQQKKRGRNPLQKGIVIFNARLSVCARERYMLYIWSGTVYGMNRRWGGCGGCWDRVNARAIDRSSC